MKIIVVVKTGAKKENIIKNDEFHFAVSVKEPPVGNKANLAVIKLLANYFKIPKSNIRISTGLKSKSKIIDIS